MIKLLVVDDEEDVCNFVKNFFSVRGLEVLTALDGEEGLKIIETEDPLIVLLDIRMPGIDGIETLRRMIGKRPNNIVIMVTCVDDLDKMEEAKKIGAEGYITKPLVLDNLVNAVMNAVPKLKPNK